MNGLKYNKLETKGVERQQDIRAECCINKEHVHSQIFIGCLKKYVCSRAADAQTVQFVGFLDQTFCKVVEEILSKPLGNYCGLPHIEELGAELSIHPADMFSTQHTNPQ